MNTLLFRKILLLWYNSHKRDLPWRKNLNPYNVWISEIVLQQTRINQGIHYYNRFIDKYPDNLSLASANEEEVLKMWQGLGYYTRARNLHFASKQILNEFNGTFPNNFSELKKLKGVGEYTAAAIASIVFNEPVAAIDGNVYRVLARLFAIDLPANSASGKNYFKKMANDLIDPNLPGDFNQAMMEFGALQCVPANPDCSICPFRNECAAFRIDSVSKFPIKKRTPKIKDRFFHYFIIEQGQSVLFKQRTGEDIWKNMYDFPLLETNNPLTPEELMHTESWKHFFNNKKVTIIKQSEEISHLLSHQRIHARFYHLLPDSFENMQSHYFLIDKKDISSLPVPKIIESYLLKLDFT
jgi:A/G-specific adenine glycosylase